MKPEPERPGVSPGIQLAVVGVTDVPLRKCEGDNMSQPAQQQDVPGIQSDMRPIPDCGEQSYQGNGKPIGKVP